MKKTIKNTKLTAVVAAAVLAATCMLSCQNSFAEMTVNENASVEAETSRAAKSDSEKIDEMYKKMNKPKGWEYKGEKIAVTRVLGEVTSLIPINDIKDENLKALAKVGTRALEAGAKYLDKFLNSYTCGLYGVATDIFWPSENKTDPAILKINDKLCEMETQLNDMDSKMTDGMDKIQSSIIRSSDKAYLRNRHEQLVKMQNLIQKPEITDFLRGSKDGNMSFSDYRQLLSVLVGDTPFSGSIPDVMTTANTMYSLYVDSMTGDDSFDKICDRYARSICAWGFEYDNIMKGFATSELMTTAQVFNILKAVYSPFISDDQVNYNYEVMQLLADAYTRKGSLYNNLMDMINGQLPESNYDDFTFTYNEETVTPDMFFYAESDPAKLYEYLLAFLCKSKKAIFPADYVDVVFGGMNIENLEGIDGKYTSAAAKTKMENLNTYMKSKNAGFNRWTFHVELYNKYVNEVNKLYETLTNDGTGYVTCMIPGVKRTFLKTMGYVRFGHRVYSEVGCHWEDDTNYINDIFHGQDIQGSYNTNGANWNRSVNKEFTNNLQKEVYNNNDYQKLTKNTFNYMTKEEYEKIFIWYRDSEHKLYKSVPVTYTDKDGNVLKIEKNTKVAVIENPSFNEIFYYGAGIGLKMDVKYQDNGWVVFTPLADLSDNTDVLGLENGKWDSADGAKPADLNNLFEIGVDYAYEEGRPVSKVVNEHGNIFTAPKPYDTLGIVEYRVESYCLKGDKKDSTWNGDNMTRTNWLVTNLPNERNQNTPEDALFTYKNYKKYADMCTNPTYIFPSCVHDMNWDTYWDKRNSGN